MDVSEEGRRPSRCHEGDPTPAEARLATILDEIGEGKPDVRYQREWGLAGKYIIDFFFPSVRMGVEFDGRSHERAEQVVNDREKARTMFEQDITLLRIKNFDEFGPHEVLLAKLRAGWRAARDGERMRVKV